MAEWLLLSLAVITFANRYAFLSSWLHYTPSARVKRFLSYSSYAVLTAIWTPLVLQMDSVGALQITGLDYLLGTVVAAGLTILRFPSVVVLLLSSAVFFLWRFLF